MLWVIVAEINEYLHLKSRNQDSTAAIAIFIHRYIDATNTADSHIVLIDAADAFHPLIV
jgi:hypothetical protein